MKIIKKGQIPSEHTFRCNCHKCNTIFEFERKEGKMVYDERRGDHIQIKCPLCGHICTNSSKI